MRRPAAIPYIEKPAGCDPQVSILMRGGSNPPRIKIELSVHRNVRN